MDKSYKQEFEYKHDNPYHDRLEKFGEFVLRDDEGEAHRGQWNQNVFKREAPLYVEIGSGYGHFMMEFCEKNPDINYVGLDYRFKRSFQLAQKLAKHPTKNFRYLRAKGERLAFLFNESEVDKIFYFFPDPWPKTRHHKKRLFQGPFLERAHHILKAGGELIVKTDHDGYAEWMVEEMDKCPLFTVELKTFDLWNEVSEHILVQYQTKFEKIFLQKNVPIKAFVLKSNKR